MKGIVKCVCVVLFIQGPTGTFYEGDYYPHFTVGETESEDVWSLLSKIV